MKKRILLFMLLGLAELAILSRPTSALTKDFVFLVRSRDAASLWAININSGQGSKLMELPYDYYQTSPDERMVSFFVGQKDGGADIGIFDHATGQRSYLPEIYKGDYEVPNYFLPNGKIFFSSYGGKSYYTFDFRTRKVEKLSSAIGDRYYRATSFSDDGKFQIYSPLAGPNIKLVDSKNQETAITVNKEETAKSCPSNNAAFSPKSSFVLVPCEKTALLIDPSSKKVVDTWTYESSGGKLDKFKKIVWVTENKFVVHSQIYGLLSGVGKNDKLTIFTVDSGKKLKKDKIFYASAYPRDLTQDSQEIRDLAIRGDEILYVTYHSLGNYDEFVKYKVDGSKRQTILKGKTGERLMTR